MKSLKDVQINSYLHYGAAKNQGVYHGEEVGLTFAFGIAGGESSITQEELADYGSMNAYYETWNDETTPPTLNKIPSRPCVLSDFGLDKTQKKPNQTFYDLEPSQISFAF